jgi:hypothetical protein
VKTSGRGEGVWCFGVMGAYHDTTLGKNEKGIQLSLGHLAKYVSNVKRDYGILGRKSPNDFIYVLMRKMAVELL